jgi:hypothetical protein
MRIEAIGIILRIQKILAFKFQTQQSRPFHAARAHIVPAKNEQHQHSKAVLVKWSFSRRLGRNVSHTCQGVVNVPQRLFNCVKLTVSVFGR